jgi:hypothetical protein
VDVEEEITDANGNVEDIDVEEDIEESGDNLDSMDDLMKEAEGDVDKEVGQMEKGDS